jgi:hypothetical protein
MAAVIYYVALAFKKAEDDGDIVACDPREARNSEQAIRMAAALSLEGGCGDFEDSREVDVGLLTA